MADARYLPPQPTSVSSVTVSHAVVLFCVLSFGLTMALPIFRVLTYAIPALAAIAMLAAARITLPPHALPFLVLMVSGLAYAPITPLVGWQDLYLMLIGLTPFFFGWRYRFSWNAVMAVSVVAFAISVAVNGGPKGGVAFDAMHSKSSFESSTSFVFGLLAVWAGLERRPGRALFALAMCILTLKRIVVLGAALAVLLTLPPRRWVDLLLRPVPMLLLNALYLWLIVQYTQGNFDRLIFEFTGQSGNQFGMGRQWAYQYPVQQLLRHPIESVFYGVGPGGIYDLMKGGWSFLAKVNLHNDSLKILVEYGGIVWLAFFTALYWFRDVRLRLVMLFYNVLLLTDNCLIYTYVIFGLGLVATALQDSAPRRVASRP